MTEVLMLMVPHESNGRATIDDDDNDFWFGFEQEYFFGIQKQTFHWFSKDQTLKVTVRRW